MLTIAPRAPRRFIESQLAPVVQAFGFEGGWSVERRWKGKESRRGFAASLPPWPCAAPGCKGMVQWRPKSNRGHNKLPRYCSSRCKTRDAHQHRPADYKVKKREYDKARRRRRTPEERARDNKLAEARKAKRSLDRIALARERNRQWQQTRRASRTREQIDADRARDRARYPLRFPPRATLSPELLSHRRAYDVAWREKNTERARAATRKYYYKCKLRRGGW